jgi:hypothetical protein
MNLSIFSSKGEFRVVTGVILLLLVCEALVRLVERRISIDIRHIQELPAIAERLRNANPVRTLFLGNSLTRAGVDLKTIRQNVPAANVEDYTLESIYPDDTTIVDWYYVYRTFLVNRQIAPSLVVVGYALDHLGDHSVLHMGRLGGYFGGWSDLPEAFRNDIPGLGDRIQYLVSIVSRLFANQERIRDRLLDLVVPNYRASAQLLNRATQQVAERQQMRDQQTYRRLRRFIQLVQSNGTKLVFVAMPLPNSYPIPEPLRATVDAEGALLLDLRHIKGLAAGDFPDGYHLSPSGARIYSSALTGNLQKLGLLDGRAETAVMRPQGVLADRGRLIPVSR